MTNQEAIKYLKQIYPYGGCCWLDEMRTEAIRMAITALEDSIQMDGYVARLKNGQLGMFDQKPYYTEIQGEPIIGASGGIMIPRDAFPELTWNNQQIAEVTVTITPKKGGDDVQKR